MQNLLIDNFLVDIKKRDPQTLKYNKCLNFLFSEEDFEKWLLPSI